MNSFILRCCALALVFVGATAYAQTRELSARGQLLDRIAAVVNDGVVLSSELDEEVDGVIERLRQQNTELPPHNVLRRQVLERLVLQQIQLQRAERIGIQVADEMLNSAMNDVAQRNGIAFSDLPQVLENQGIDYRNYRDEIRRTLTLQMLRQRDVLARVNVSPRELEQFMARQQNSPDQNSEYNVSHILISVPVAATPEQLTAREQRAREVFQKATSGEDFAQLAVTYSESSTNIEGGALGWRKGVQLPSIASDQIARMKPGDVTEPIRTPSGFHLFRLNEIRGAAGQQSVVSQVHARHILMRTNELEDDETVRQKLARIRERVVQGGEDFAVIAASSSQDPGSAADGGDLGWAGPGTFDPAFEAQLDKLEENDISEPFKTQFGWHIVQLLGRRVHDVSDDMRRNRAFAALREAKAEEETELWLRRLRDDAFIEYRL
jgi:peptidyl-prolyl cis-trans isomerase SurA